MKVWVLCKRFYTAKDVIGDRYGRLFELPSALAQRGHEVAAFATAYRFTAETDGVFVQDEVTWRSTRVAPAGLLGVREYLLKQAETAPPDVIWASSDVLHVAAGAWLSTRAGVPLVVDLYDDYEAFGLTRVPGMRHLLRKACRRADALTVVSNTLEKKVRHDYRVTSPIHVLGNGVRDDLFRSRNPVLARVELGLPENARFIGAVGSLTDDRGIDDLWQAFQKLAVDDENLWLVLAGRRGPWVERWSHPRLRWLGELPLETAAKVVSALDVAVVCNRDSLFGRSCHPLKLVEAIAAERPLVAADVGDVGMLLADRADCLYAPGDPDMLAARIREQLLAPSPVSGVVTPSWAEVGAQLETVLRNVVEERPI